MRAPALLAAALLSVKIRTLPSPRCSAADDDDANRLLSSRIDAMRKAEAQAEAKRAALLMERIASVEAADEREAAMATCSFARLPVVCFDAMLPGQRLELTTEDPTLCNFLMQLGLGGMFCMTSLDPRERRVRRHGVVVRIALVDVARSREGVPVGYGAPTLIRTSLVGRTRCVLIDERASQALGRWRRQYDPEGDEPRLGWGEEPLLSLPEGVVSEGVVAEGVVAEGVVAEGIVAAAAAQGAGINGEDKGAADEDIAPSDPWVPLRVRLLHGEAELVTTERMPSTGGGSSSSSAGAGVVGFGSSAADMPADAVARAAAAKELELAELAGAVLSALAEWEALARDSATYANVDVACAGLRVQNGLPALRRDPAALLDGIKLDLGPRPDARAQPTAFALWVAALLNPLPALGVAPELRASVLMAVSAEQRLLVVERGLRRSIANLRGEQPL